MLWIGVGCRRGTSKEMIETAIDHVLKSHQISLDQILGIATIDLKSDELGLLHYCQDHQLVLQFFAAEQLQAITVPNPSLNRVGTTSVAEAAAMCAARSNRLIVTKQVIEKTVTIAIAQSSLE